MLENLLVNGSIIGVLMMIIPNTIALHLTRMANNPMFRDKVNSNPLNTVNGLIGTFGGLFWCPIYVGMFEGLWVGILTLILFGLIGMLLSKTIDKIKLLPEIFYISSVPLSIVGIYLTSTNMPA